MSDRQLKKRLAGYLDRTREEGVDPAHVADTAGRCVALLREQRLLFPEPRLGFWRFLSGVFRFAWPSILFFQAAALLLVSLFVYGAARDLRTIPAYIPLFVLAALPVLFRAQYFGTGELEAAACASGAQLALARLILSGGANLVCMTGLMWLEVRLTGSARELGRMILYCLVPYLVCMTVLLRLVRRRGRDSMPLSVVMALSSCLFWRASARMAPGLYELSAVGAWLAAFTVFSAFFLREIYFIVKADREGRMYGTFV